MGSANGPIEIPQHTLIHDARAMSALLNLIASRMDAYKLPRLLWQDSRRKCAIQLRSSARNLRDLAASAAPLSVMRDEILNAFDLAEKSVLTLPPRNDNPALRESLLQSLRAKHAELRRHWVSDQITAQDCENQAGALSASEDTADNPHPL